MSACLIPSLSHSPVAITTIPPHAMVVFLLPFFCIAYAGIFGCKGMLLSNVHNATQQSNVHAVFFTCKDTAVHCKFGGRQVVGGRLASCSPLWGHSSGGRHQERCLANCLCLTCSSVQTRGAHLKIGQGEDDECHSNNDKDD